jgi:SAM-dependent methyltransferase
MMMLDSGDDQRRDHEGRVIDFGRTSADYERFRPGFPSALFDRFFSEGWVAPGQSVLDLGTGTGTVALGLAERGLEATGLDIAPELLEIARGSADDRALSAEFIGGSAEATGLASSAYDVVTAGQCWWWFDEGAVLTEVERLLVVGGRLIICSFSYLPLGATAAGATEELILEHNPGWPKAGWRGVHPEQVEALDRRGFEQVESFSFTVNVAFTHEGWRGRIRTCNGVGSALAPEQVERFDTDLAAMLSERFPGPLNVLHRVFAVSGVMPRL